MHFSRSFRHCRFLVVALALAGAFAAPHLAAAPSTSWTFTKVTQAGENGFTRIDFASVNAQGVTFVKGKRSNNDVGLYHVQGTVVTPVAVNGAALPGIGTVNPIGIFQADPLGRVVFVGDVLDQNNVATSTAFRWVNGTVTPMLPQGPGVAHLPTKMASDGRWLTNTATGDFYTANYLLNGTQQFQLTDGTTATDLGTFTTTSNDSNRAAFAVFPVANASGALLIGRTTNNNELGLRDGFLEFNTTWTYELRLMTPGNSTPTVVAQGTLIDNRTVEPDTMNGTLVDFDEADLNDAGKVLFKRSIYTGSERSGPRTEELVLRDAVGEQVLAQVAANGRFPAISGFRLDDAARVAYTLALQDSVTGSVTGTGICAGPDPFTDRIVSSGDTLFGQTLKSVQLLDVAFVPGAASDRRVLLFSYTLQDDTRGMGTATTAVARWTNVAGGPWATAGNWMPASVPGVTDATAFDLEGNYDVTVGARTSGRASIESGSVAFLAADLTLTGPFAIGDDATFTLAEGKITAGELTLGSLPPSNLLLPPVAHFNLSNQGTEFTTTGPVLIGAAGQGDLFISKAKMTSGEVRVGAGAKGTASIGMSPALWSTGALAVGFTHEATLAIEHGGRMESTSAVIGLGSVLKNELATVNVDNDGGPTTSAGHWFVTNTLTVGDKLPGRLNIFSGASIGVGGLVKTALAKHAGIVDAAIEVDGTGSTNARRSSLYFLTDAELGSGPNTFTDVSVLAGGFWHTGDALALGEAPGSIGQVLVSGVNANNLRSELEQGVTGNGSLAVGRSGQGIVVIGDGGLVSSRQVLIGGLAGGRGEVYVGGRQRGFDATLQVTDMLVVGGNQVFGTVEGSPGTLTVESNGLVNAGNLLVFRNGRVRGNGTIIAAVTFNSDGVIEPGVGFDLPLEELSPMTASPFTIKVAKAGAAPRPGTLTIQGNLVLGPTGKIKLDVEGPGAGAGDKLVVTGTLTMGGAIELNFTGGYLPRQGDTLDLVSASTATGSFATTTITGLAPGFQYDLASNAAGGVRLTAMNDAVSSAPISIVVQPLTQGFAIGGSVTLSVVAGGTGPFSYQWKKDNVAIAGATNSSYSISSAVASDAGSYTAVVANPAGSVTSNAAVINPLPAGFDVAGYYARNPDVAAIFVSDTYGAWLYYRNQGIYQGEVFDDLFRVEEYLGLYPELFAIFGSDLGAALDHWLGTGRIEGKLGRIPLEFSATGYFSRNPDVATAVGNNVLLAWNHYWLYGIYEGRAYDDELRVFEYLAINADLTAAFVNDWRQAALHWMRYGRTEGRLGRIPLLFDVPEYLTRYPAVQASWGSYPTTVFLHYWLYGVDEGKNFDDVFRVNEYLALNPDLLAIFGTDRRGAFKHWVRYGKNEGRPGKNP